MANSVVATPKFLSLILSFLEIRDLLVSAQLVNRNWNSIVATTVSLQIALFFKPSESTTARILNPLLKEIFPPWFESPASYSGTHPRNTALSFQQLSWAQRAPVFQRGEASWRKMLVVSGGVEVRNLRVIWLTQSMLGWQECRGMLACDDGLRMGVLWDLTKDFCVSHRNASFMMNWPEDLFSCERHQREPGEESSWKERFQKMFRWKRRGRYGSGLSARSWILSAVQEDAVSDDKRGGSSEEHVLELVLTSAILCEPRGWDMPPVLGQEFQSQAYQKVSIEYADSKPCPGP